MASRDGDGFALPAPKRSRPGDAAAGFLYGSVRERGGERARSADAFNRAYVLGLAQGPNY